MKTGTKTLLWGGVATAVLGPTLVAGAIISVGGGVGTFAGILTGDGLPALTDGFQNYTPGQVDGLFGEPGADAPAEAPLGSAPGGPANPS